jgi:hypothetical protein
VVTGAARGIGRAIAARLHADGWAVVLNDADAAAGRAAACDLGDRAAFRAGDVGDEPAIRSLVAFAVERFGRLDAAVSNAGIMVRKPVTDLALDEWRRVLDTNLTGTFLLAKHAAPYLKATRGSIVAIASTRALMSEPDTEAYAASKGGLVALTHALALSLGPEVRVNCVSPGWIDTTDGTDLRPKDHAQHPAGRVGTPGDVAELAAYLVAGERSGFVTGANLVIDGGMTRKMTYAP